MYPAPKHGGEAMCTRGQDFWIPRVKMKRQNWLFFSPCLSDALIQALDPGC